MLFLKSFFRKKSIKIYLAIFTLTISFIFLSIYAKGFYNDLVNKNNKNSYFDFKYFPNEIEKIKNIDNVLNVAEGLIIKNEFGNYYIFPSDDLNLKDFEISVEHFLLENINIGDNIQLLIGNEEKNFTIKSFFTSAANSNVICVNTETFNSLEKLLKPDNNIYRVTLKNWNKDIETSQIIENELNITNITKYSEGNANMNYDLILSFFNITVIIFIVVFVIVFIVTLINIVIDEKKMTYLYHCIGYSNKKLLLITLSKLFILFITSLTISLILYLIFLGVCSFK